MLGSRPDFDSAARVSGKEPGWEACFFRSYGELRGIFIQSDRQRTNLYHTLTHEYVHFLMDEVLQGAELPAWLNEGLAEYYEFEVGMKGDCPMLLHADVAHGPTGPGRPPTRTGCFACRNWKAKREWKPSPPTTWYPCVRPSHCGALPDRTLRRRRSLDIARLNRRGNSVGDARGLGYRSSTATSNRVHQWLKSWDDPARAGPGIPAGLKEMDASSKDLRAFRARPSGSGAAVSKSDAKKNASRGTAAAALDGPIPPACKPTPPLSPSCHEGGEAYFEVLEEC